MEELEILNEVPVSGLQENIANNDKAMNVTPKTDLNLFAILTSPIRYN